MNEPRFLAADTLNALEGDVFIYRAPTSSLPARLVPGAAARRVSRVITTSATVQESDGVLFVDATAGNVTITLRAATVKERVLIKKTDSSSHTVTIARIGSDTIDGATSTVLSAQYDHAHLVPDGVSSWGLF